MSEIRNRFAPAALCALAVLMIAGLAGAAAAEQSATQKPTAAPQSAASARFTMTPTENGFLRLDSQTGQMAVCREADGQWSCAGIADQGLSTQQDLAALRKENRELKDRVSQLENMLMAFKERPGAGTPTGPRTAFKLPSEKQVDRAFDYFEGMLRKFEERLNRLRKKPEESDERTL